MTAVHQHLMGRVIGTLKIKNLGMIVRSNILKKPLMCACVLILPSLLLCQQEPMPKKLGPDTIKLVQEHPGPKFGALQCRADAQKWTSDPFDNKDARNLGANPAVMVNGQFRTMPHITMHVTSSQLMERAYEMSVCEGEDADFEKQFVTYSTLSKSYSDERCFRYRYFLTKHNLEEQFYKEDAEANK
jgi:hypothetical protein